MLLLVLPYFYNIGNIKYDDDEDDDDDVYHI